MEALIKNFKFFLLLLIIVYSCFYLIDSFVNSIFTKPISNYDRLIIIEKNINETTFLNYLNQKEIKVSKIKWHISKLFLKDKFVLKHGEFLITKSDTLIDILEKINKSIVNYRKFTLIEGTNSKELKNGLSSGMV